MVRWQWVEMIAWEAPEKNSTEQNFACASLRGGVGGSLKENIHTHHIPVAEGWEMENSNWRTMGTPVPQQTSHWDSQGAQVITGRMMHLARCQPGTYQVQSLLPALRQWNFPTTEVQSQRGNPELIQGGGILNWLRKPWFGWVYHELAENKSPSGMRSSKSMLI